MATTITVTGTFKKLDGTNRTGTVKFRPTASMTDKAGNLIMSRSWTSTTIASGAISVVLYATDDTTTAPDDLLYEVRVDYTDDGTHETFFVAVPAASSGGTFDLSDRTASYGVPVSPIPSVADVHAIVNDAISPASLRISTLDCFGHSYGKLGVDHEWELYHERLAGMLHADLTVHHISGSCLIDSGVYAGGWVHMAHSVGHPHNNFDEDDYQPQRGAWCLVDGINDINTYAASTTEFPACYSDVLRATISWLSLGAAWSHYTTAGQSNPAGSFANVNNAFSPGQSPEISYRYSGSNGAQWSITTDPAAAGHTIALYFLCNKNGGSFAASTITFTVDGVATEPIGYEGVDFDTDAVLPSAAPGNGWMVARFALDDDDAAHTVVATAGAGGMSYWGYGVEAPRPGIVANIARPLDAAYTNGANDTLVETVNTAIETVVAEFGAPVVVVDIDTIMGKAAASYDDNIHPNPEKQAEMADAMYLALRAGIAQSSRKYL